MANDTPTPEQPVDLVSAGAVPQQPKNLSMADVLAAMQPKGPAIDPSVMLMMQQQSAPNPWLAAASGMAAGQGKNPYLDQQARQQQTGIGTLMQMNQLMHQRQTEAIQQATLLNTLRQQAQAREDKREEALLAINKGLLTHDSPEVRAVGARGLDDYLKAHGRERPTNFIQALTRQNVKSSEMDDVLMNIQRGTSDATILAMHPNVTPEVLAEARKNKDNVAVLESLKLKTPDERQKASLDLQKSSAELIMSRTGIKDGILASMVAGEHQRMFKKSLVEGDDATLAAAVESAYKAWNGRKEAEADMREKRLQLAEQQAAWFQAMIQYNTELMSRLVPGMPPPPTPGARPGVAGPLPAAPQAGAAPNASTPAGPLAQAAPTGGLPGAGVPGFNVGINLGPSGPRVALQPREKQIEALKQWVGLDRLVVEMDELSRRLNVDDNWVMANVHGFINQGGAKAGQNTVAATYEARKNALLGALARQVLLERGVLTNQDVERSANMLPNFRDTKQIRDMKIGLLKDYLHMNREMEEAIYSGQPFDPAASRERLMKFLATADQRLGVPPRAKPGSPQEEYNALRLRGMTREQAIEEMKRRGH